MQDFLFYTELGFWHVMDPNAYDHILFLAALALPFVFRNWKKVVLLATVFTVFHCISLALSAYDLLRVSTAWVEFLIPVTILATALLNLLFTRQNGAGIGIYLHLLATAFFGLIHGFGFSNYFNMLVAEEGRKSIPLIGFATGIEISQVLIIFLVLSLTYLLTSILKFDRNFYIGLGSIIVAAITIPMMIQSFPL